MSGHKRATVTISQEEYRRLHDADMQERFRRKKSVDTGERDRQLQEMNMVFDQMRARQDYYESLIADLDEEILQIEENTSQELLAYQTAFNQELMDRMDFVAEETNVILDTLMERFHQEIQNERANFYQSLRSLNEQFDQWRQETRNKQQLASQWVAQATRIYSFIDGQFETERFTPGRMRTIKQKLTLAQMNLDQGMPEASLQAAQQVFVELSDLRVELETRTMEWQNQFQLTYGAAKELQKAILGNAQVPALDVAGNEIPFPVDLDYWSSGAYKTLLDEAKQFVQYLKGHQRTLDVEKLQSIRNQALAMLQNRLESIIYESRLEAIQSQMRINIADLALQALENQGYRLEEAGFVEEDLRGPFVAKLVNEDRTSISLRILPKQGQDLSSDLIVVSNDSAMRTAGELFARFQAIRSSLGQKGLAIRQVQSNPPPSQRGSDLNGAALPAPIKREHIQKTSNVRSN